ncbi:MAG TPA: OmpA family protein [Saprospiraceae bacterium]|nr:OmpA family protein [Saprospiraceae bacterium]HPI05454.1 OmpA family protein [Saprospiraceae bacterium]
MNSKSLVFILFAVWSAICWRWYTCTIKGVCGETAAAMVQNGQGSGIEPVESDTVTTDLTVSEVTPSTPSGATKSAQRPATRPPVTESRMNEVQMEEVEDRMVIHFPYNSIRKEDDAAIDDYLNRLASELNSSGGNVTISGHTDFVGESKDNVRFGLLRANSIRNILIKKGVAAKQIKTRSYGESKAIATNDTPWGRYRNRRVEIRINK